MSSTDDAIKSRRTTALIAASACAAVVAAVGGVVWWRRVRAAREEAQRQITIISDTMPTAQFTALMRFLHQEFRSSVPTVASEGHHGEKFGVDPFAHYFLTAEHRTQSLQPDFKARARARFNEVVPLICNWLWSRTRVIDSELSRAIADEAHPLQQLVLLGAGYDTRSYRFRQALDARGVRRFEVDLPVLQAAKRAAMEEVVRGEGDIGLDQVTFVSLDLSRPKEELLSSMRDHGFDPRQTSLFVWEGVTAYLTRAAIIASLAFMSEGCAVGSLLLVTFLTPESHSASNKGAFGDQFARAEPRKFYPTVMEFTELLTEAGWRTERLYTPDQLALEYLMPDEGGAWPGAHIAAARRI